MKEKVVLLLSDQMGTGSKELGVTILETFFTMLKKSEEKPAAIFCMNQGVFTMTDASFVSVHLKELSEQGVSVLACKTCVEYYNIAEKLTVGKLSGMDTFVSLAQQYEVITIS